MRRLSILLMLPAVFAVTLQGCGKIQRTHNAYEPELMKYKPAGALWMSFTNRTKSRSKP
jgi:hypothetical protein